ncbi:hypothetical protein V5738_18205 [Salinisphaera sp. SPP-AMP-43]|uniref:hypothetical protein n=1 Tax=Salinisphaera sp. SPP-AMP-43 TaxID=3121288 RepID=UPI003C6E7F40
MLRHRMSVVWPFVAVTPVLLLGIGLLSGCQVGPYTEPPPDPGRYCLQQWPSDREAYLMCQQLQNRNRSEFRAYLSQHGLSEHDLAPPAAAGDPIAQTARYCLEHGAPDYQRVWDCTERRAETSPGENR